MGHEPPIELLPYTLDVRDVQRALQDPEVWNRHVLRTEQYAHADVSDIWVRFREWDDDMTLEKFNAPHKPVWYPIADEVPAITKLVHRVWAWATKLHVPGLLWEFGGVLITKIPPGKMVMPHHDRSGWHARHYNVKHAVQIMGTPAQYFCFDGYALAALPGEVYRFDNQQVHWVINDSPVDRITMIVCMRCDFHEVM